MMQLTDHQDRRLHELLDIFLEENNKLNLSAFRTKEHCWTGNIMDSIAFIDLAPAMLGNDWQRQALKILDVGTGGGFPLLPLAMLMPQAQFVGLDAVRKKTDAVRRMATALKLDNVEILNGRAEEIAHQRDFRAHFDIVFARAVAPIATLLEYCVPFLRPHGRCVLWKSTHTAEELRSSLRASTLLSANIAYRFVYDLGGDWGERELLVFEKMEATSDDYPRKMGLPKAKPL